MTGKIYKQDEGTSLKELSAAASLDDDLATLVLASNFYFGKKIPRDYKKSFEGFFKLANKGSSISMVIVGIQLINGLGVNADASIGYDWIKEAQSNDSEAAKFILKNRSSDGQIDVNGKLFKLLAEELQTEIDFLGKVEMSEFLTEVISQRLGEPVV